MLNTINLAKAYKLIEILIIMELTDKVLSSMERHNADWIVDFPEHNNKLKYQRIIDNLLIYGLKTRKYIQEFKPKFMRRFGL